MEALVLSVRTTNGGGYLFARVGRDTVLCHQEACDFLVTDAKHGDVIEVGRVESTPRGLRGRDVQWRSRTTGELHPFVGTVVRLDYDKKFVFVTPDLDPTVEGSGDVFVHIADFVDYNENSDMFEALSLDDRVTGYWRLTSRGRRGYQVSV